PPSSAQVGNGDDEKLSMIQDTVQADFLSDVREHFAACLTAMGYQVPPRVGSLREDTEQILLLYYNAMKRRVSPRPRRVHRSREIQRRVLSQVEMKALDRIAAAAEAGEDLSPRLSKGVRKLEGRDLLLYDWGIHHLHLGAVD